MLHFKEIKIFRDILNFGRRENNRDSEKESKEQIMQEKNQQELREEIQKQSEIVVEKKDKTKIEGDTKEEARVEEVKYQKGKKEKSNFHKGLNLYRDGDFTNAKEYFQKSIKDEDEDCIKSMYFIGKTYVKEGNKKTGKIRQEYYKKAEQQFKECIEQSSEDLQSLLELAKLYLKQGKNKEAYKILQRYIKMSKDMTSEGRVWLGKLYIKEGKYEEAKEQFERCIEIDGNKYAIELLKMLSNGDKNEEKQFDNIFDKKNEDSQGLEHIENMKIRQKLYLQKITEEDIKEIKKLIEKNREQKENYLVLVAIYERMGQKKNALDIIKQMQQNGIEIKGLAQVKERLNSRKARIYDMAKWDELIGWNVTQIKNENKSKQDYESKVEKRNEKASIREKVIMTNIQLQGNEIDNKDDKVEESHKKKKKPQYIIQEGIRQKSGNIQKKSETRQVKEKDVNAEKRKIRDSVGISIKEVTDKIGQTYYVQMQLYNDGVLNTRAEIERRQKYIKKYDKLQSILECSENNKRAKMELMLVLMNEGYSKVVENEFPKEYEYINKLVEEYKKKTKTAKEVRQEIDEYCL